LTAGEAKNVDNAVVLARLFNEASGQKAPSKKHGLFISRPLWERWRICSLRTQNTPFIFSRTLFFTHLHFIASRRHKLGLEDLDRDGARIKRYCSSKTIVYRSHPNPSRPSSFRSFIAPALAPKNTSNILTNKPCRIPVKPYLCAHFETSLRANGRQNWDKT
jgi:hypothetical protein